MDIIKWLQDKLSSAGNAVANAPINSSLGPLGGLLPSMTLNNSVLPAARNIAQDVGAGIASNQNPATQASQQATMDMAKKAYEKSLTTKDPAEKARLQAVAKSGLQTVSQGAQGLSQGFSPDVQQDPMLRGLKGGAEIGTTADVLGGLASQMLPKAAATVGLPAMPGEAPVAPQDYTSPAGVKYPFKNPGMLGQAKDLLAGIQKIPGVPLVEGAAGALGALKYGVPAAEEALGGLKAVGDVAGGKAAAAGVTQTPEEQQKQLDADVPNPLTAGTVKTTTDLTKNLTDLQALQGSPAYMLSKQFDPLHAYASKVDAQLNNAQTQLSTQQQMQTNYTKTAALDQQYNNVINAIGGNTGFAKATDWYQRWASSGDPQFAAFTALLPTLKAQGVDTDKIINGTGESAASQLNAAKQQMLTDYKSAYKTYGETPLEPIEIPAPTAQPTPAKTFIPGPLGGGGGLPATPQRLEPNGMPMKKKIEIPPRYMYR